MAKQFFANRKVINSSAFESFGESLLTPVLNYIQDSTSPDQIFHNDTLVEWVRENRQPDEVFSYDELRAWAEANGFNEQQV